MSIEIIFYDKEKDSYVNMLDPENGFASLQVLKYIQQEVASQRFKQTTLGLIAIISTCDVCKIGSDIFDKFPILTFDDAENIKHQISEDIKIQKKVRKAKKYGEGFAPTPNCSNCIHQSKANQN